MEVLCIDNQWLCSTKSILDIYANFLNTFSYNVIMKLEELSVKYCKRLNLLSETGFREFSTHCHCVWLLCPFSNDSFSIWQTFELILAYLLSYWQNFHCCKWPNIKQII